MITVKQSSRQAKQPIRELTCIGVFQGIVGVINEDGRIEHYAMRNLRGLTQAEATHAIELGLIDPRAFSLKPLPKNIHVVFEDNCMRTSVSFNKKVLYNM